MPQWAHRVGAIAGRRLNPAGNAAGRTRARTTRGHGRAASDQTARRTSRVSAGIRRRLVRTLGLPADIVFDLPRITLLGRLQLTVENHQGIRSFLAGRVIIATRDGQVVVEGDDLHVGVVREGEVSVTGLLRGVRLEP